MTEKQLYEFVSVIILLSLRLCKAELSSVEQTRPSSFVEWWGDKRAELEPGRAFLDLIIHEEICPDGAIVGSAVEDYTLVGTLLESRLSNSSSDCASACLRHPQCASANFYHPGTLKEKKEGLCQLIKEDQATRPQWMKPYPDTTHYSNLRCQQGSAWSAGVSRRRAESYFMRALLKKLAAKRAKTQF